LKSMAVVSSDVKQTISKLAVYPIVITFCWLPNTILTTIYFIVPNITYPEALLASFDAVAASQRLLLSASFFYLNPFVRTKYRKLLIDYHLSHPQLVIS
jgi:hypothetical protein